MATLVNNIHSPREKLKMPPVPTAQPDTPSRKSALKPFNGESPTKTNSPFLRIPSKKKLKWSSDKKQTQDLLSDTENNKSKSIKSALASASASSFFNAKPTNVTPTKKEGSSNVDNSTNSPLSAAIIPKRLRDEGLASARRSLQEQRILSHTFSEDEESIPSTPVTPSTPLTPSTPVTPDRCTSNLSHSLRVVEEIITTERQYVKDLQDIIEGYLGCMRKDDSPVSADNVRDLFMRIEDIYEFNRGFLEDLENSDDDPVEVAYCFVHKEDGFETYTEYCTKYPISMEVLTDLTRQKETAAFLQKIQTDLGHPLPLGSYLLKPVQRILKYHLLLQDIQKHFDKDDDQEGYDTVSDALDAMQGVAHHINEMKRKHEVALHVQEIQSQLSDFEGPDLTTYGNLVLEDSFRMTGTRTDRYLFLFERILLITKKRENGYTCKATLLLSNMMMTEAVAKEPLAFTIIRFDNQKVDYSFVAQNTEQKNKWTLALKRLLLESLAASVPIKAKNLILGEENVDEEESPESDNRKKSGLDARSSPRRHSFRGSGSSPSRKAADKNNNVKEERERSKSPDALSDDGKVPTVSVSSEASETQTSPQSPPTSPLPAEPVALLVEEWERRGGASDEPTADRNSSELEDDAFLPASYDRRLSAEDILAVTKERRQSDNTAMSSRAVTSDSEYPDAAHAHSTPWVPKRSSSLKRMEARLSLEKCMSDGDLREGVAMNPGLAGTDSNRDMTNHLDNFSDNSKIQKTVRDVAKAFQGPASPVAQRPWDPASADATNASTNHVLRSLKGKSKRENNTSALDDLLASIDRELDETRRTISNAQLLESALRLKREPSTSGMDLIWEDHADRVNGHSYENEDHRVEYSRTGNQMADLEELTDWQAIPERSILRVAHAGETSRAYPISNGQEISPVLNTAMETIHPDEEAERDIKAELAAWVKQSTPIINSLFPIGENLRTSSLDRRRGKKVFEMSPRDKFDRYSAGDIPLVEAETPSNVYRMARQYSKRITDESKVRDIRSRSSRPTELWASPSESSTSSESSPTKIDRSPRMKIQRVTKVTFDDSLDEKRVIRRRRRPGHSARDQKRASWSFEKTKPEIDGLQRSLRRERPRSLHEIKPAPKLIEFDGDDSEMFPDGFEAGLAPAMLEGMEKDDIVVKGLVKHLVNKFNPNEEGKASNKPCAELL